MHDSSHYALFLHFGCLLTSCTITLYSKQLLIMPFCLHCILCPLQLLLITFVRKSFTIITSNNQTFYQVARLLVLLPPFSPLFFPHLWAIGSLLNPTTTLPSCVSHYDLGCMYVSKLRCLFALEASASLGPSSLPKESKLELGWMLLWTKVAKYYWSIKTINFN